MYQLPFEPPLDHPEPDTAFFCSICGYPIAVGDDYYDIDGEHICPECIAEYIDRNYKSVAEKTNPYYIEER